MEFTKYSDLSWATHLQVLSPDSVSTGPRFPQISTIKLAKRIAKQSNPAIDISTTFWIFWPLGPLPHQQCHPLDVPCPLFFFCFSQASHYPLSSRSSSHSIPQSPSSRTSSQSWRSKAPMNTTWNLITVCPGWGSLSSSPRSRPLSTWGCIRYIIYKGRQTRESPRLYDLGTLRKSSSFHGCRSFSNKPWIWWWANAYIIYIFSASVIFLNLNHVELRNTSLKPLTSPFAMTSLQASNWLSSFCSWVSNCLTCLTWKQHWVVRLGRSVKHEWTWIWTIPFVYMALMPKLCWKPGPLTHT